MVSWVTGSASESSRPCLYLDMFPRHGSLIQRFRGLGLRFRLWLILIGFVQERCESAFIFYNMAIQVFHGRSLFSRVWFWHLRKEPRGFFRVVCSAPVVGMYTVSSALCWFYCNASIAWWDTRSPAILLIAPSLSQSVFHINFRIISSCFWDECFWWVPLTP